MVVIYISVTHYIFEVNSRYDSELLDFYVWLAVMMPYSSGCDTQSLECICRCPISANDLYRVTGKQQVMEFLCVVGSRAPLSF